MWKNIIDTIDKVYIPSINILDFVEIMIITVCMYYIIKSVRNTRMWVVIKGLLLLGLFYLIAYIFSFNAILTIFQTAAIALMAALVIVFQPEIRKFLEKIGSKTNLLPYKNKNKYTKNKISDNTINQIITACQTLSKTKTGALIVIEKDIPLNEYIETGIPLNSDISSQLLINIFEKNTPLHDGAIIIKNDKVVAATCYLPLSKNEKINKKYGTRHRAAIGISETTDAFVVVVSEETGHISVAQKGKIKSRMSEETLRNELTQFQNKTSIILKPTLKDFIFKNFKLKIISFGLSLIFWTILINISNPIVTKTFYNIPITVQNEQSITEIGKTYTIKSEETVNVSVKCNKKSMDSIKNEDIIVVADFDKLSEVYSITLSGNVVNAPNAEVYIYDNTMKIALENLVETEFKIEVQQKGSSNEDCFVSAIIPKKETLSIKGAESIMKIVDKVCVDVDITGINENKEITVAPIIYDKNGSVMDNTKFSLDADNIEIKIETLRAKTVPVHIILKPEDELTQTLIKSYDADIKEIKIAGTNENINTVDEINIDVPITINNLQAGTENFAKNIKFKDYLNANNIYLTNNELSANVSIVFNEENIKRKLKIPTSNITIQNQSNRYNYKPENEFLEVIISGNKKDVISVVENNVMCSANVKGYYTGTRNVLINFNSINGINFAETYAKFVISYK